MFCPNCGKQIADGVSFCEHCGFNMQSAGIQQPQRMINQPQDTFILPQGYPLRKPGRRKGLVAGLITGGVLLAAAAIAVVLLFMGCASVAGFWYNTDRGEALEFKTDNSFYIYSVSAEYEGEYTFDKSKNEGVVTFQNYEHKFAVDKDSINIDGIGEFKKADNKFSIDEFIAQLPTPTPAPTIAPTPEPTPEPTEAIETVSAQSMTLPFVFGECTGTYTGEVLGGLPEGYGTFSCPYTDGTSWTYEGGWTGGHLNGQGRTEWEYGFSEQGQYVNDFLNGDGSEYWYGRVYYSGQYLDSTSHGQGTLYSYYEEPIFTGNFSYGFIQETPEAREARLEQFKSLCDENKWKELYDACYYESKTYTYIEGDVFDVYEYGSGNDYYCDFLMYVSGVEDKEHIVQVFYRLTEGEPLITEGQKVKVWGTTAYLYSYTSEGNEFITVPTADAWSVE